MNRDVVKELNEIGEVVDALLSGFNLGTGGKVEELEKVVAASESAVVVKHLQDGFELGVIKDIQTLGLRIGALVEAQQNLERLEHEDMCGSRCPFSRTGSPDVRRSKELVEAVIIGFELGRVNDVDEFKVRSGKSKDREVNDMLTEGFDLGRGNDAAKLGDRVRQLTEDMCKIVGDGPIEQRIRQCRFRTAECITMVAVLEGVSRRNGEVPADLRRPAGMRVRGW
ncbi:hypothetical protein HY570_04235 [Candidatus Micrarchaeota archaeon]|nr:hypothetical protein [Candidatus Micrarchaeota archaeon]